MIWAHAAGMEMNLVRLAKEYADEDRAREYLESLRWPRGPICPHCGAEGAYRLTAKPGSTRGVRKGVLKCKVCRKQFTVRVGTIFEDSHIPLGTWVLAIHLLCASKKGMSAHQLHRMLGVTYKSAWFMAHRIRYAMGQPPLSGKLSGIVEADEAYIGGSRQRGRRKRGAARKKVVFSLVERRPSGNAHSVALDRVTAKNFREAMLAHIEPDATIMTDEHPAYRSPVKGWTHEHVKHSLREYVRGEAHINTVEGYFGLLKRGITGTYHHVSKGHLHRYLAEFDFRWNQRHVEDGIRAALAVRATEGKRLTFREG
jgi:transposase-like protein